MHCPPAQRGREIGDEATDGPQSALFDQKGCTPAGGDGGRRDSAWQRGCSSLARRPAGVALSPALRSSGMAGKPCVAAWHY